MVELDFTLPRRHFDLVVQETLPQGITGIFGPSGSGKTSLLHAIAGLDLPKTGTIKVNDRVLLDMKRGIRIPVAQRNIGYVFQEGRLFPHMTVADNLKYGIKKQPHKPIAYAQVIALLKLESLLDSKPSEISGGEQQRVALGRALLSSPDILLMDEPFSALDIHLRDQIIPFIYQVQKQIKIPILVVSHDLSELLKLTSRILCISQGRCIGHGSLIDLLKAPKTSALFGGRSLVNSIEMTCQPGQSGDLNTLQWTDGAQTVTIKCQKYALQPGQQVRVFLYADDISLSTGPVEHITTQNQIRGSIASLIDRDQVLLCIVDVGFKLIVEITHDSRKRLGIEENKPIWCLFKSVAIGLAQDQNR